MDLKSRLGALRRQSGTEPAAPAVAERLQRYRAAGRGGPRRGGITDQALAQQLAGCLLDEGVILIERRVALDQCHGRIALEAVRRSRWALPEARGLAPEGLVFLDTETSGLAGGTGTVVFLLGLARIEGSELVVRQYHLTRFAAEAAMLRLAGEWLTGGECIVSYNGKGFDVPLLATRYRLRGVRDPLTRLAHLDLLHPTRRAFQRRWGDCRLATAERKLLGFERQDDLPGSEAPAAWLDWLQRGDPARLPGIARHNLWDVLSLAALLPALDRVHDAPGSWEADVAAVARWLRARGDEARSLHLLAEHREMLDRDGLLELARCYRRARRWPEARTIWEPLAEAGCGEAIERLAKYHEHVAGDLRRALDYAGRLPAKPAHEARRRRLRQRLAAHGASAGNTASIFPAGLDPTGAMG